MIESKNSSIDFDRLTIVDYREQRHDLFNIGRYQRRRDQIGWAIVRYRHRVDYNPAPCRRSEANR